MPRSVGIIMWSVCLLIENLHPQCLQLNAGRHGGLHYNNRSTKYCSAKRLVISLQWGLLPQSPECWYPLSGIVWRAEEACLLFLVRQDSSVWARRLQGAIQTSLTNFTSVLCLEWLGATHVACITQLQVGRTGPENWVCYS